MATLRQVGTKIRRQDPAPRSGAKISMSRKGRPQDNAFMESFFKTLKTEEVEWNEYESLSAAQAQIGVYIEREYNRTRLHSSLGYRPPQEYERQWEEAADVA